jgi:hypothetical protein
MVRHAKQIHATRAMLSFDSVVHDGDGPCELFCFESFWMGMSA